MPVNKNPSFLCVFLNIKLRIKNWKNNSHQYKIYQFDIPFWGHWTPLVIVKEQYCHIVFLRITKSFDSVGHQSCKRIMTEKHTRAQVCFQVANKKGFRPEGIWVRNDLSLKNYTFSGGAVPHNVLYYQQFSIARYQVTFLLTIILSNNQKCRVALRNILT